jgi:hypothetical protein
MLLNKLLSLTLNSNCEKRPSAETLLKVFRQLPISSDTTDVEDPGDEVNTLILPFSSLAVGKNSPPDSNDFKFESSKLPGSVSGPPSNKAIFEVAGGRSASSGVSAVRIELDSKERVAPEVSETPLETGPKREMWRWNGPRRRREKITPLSGSVEPMDVDEGRKPPMFELIL